jgi:hypothetical protein
VGLFSSKPRYEPSKEPRVSISGRPNFVRTEIGGANRRPLLFATSVRALARHPLAQPKAAGRPLGDGVGMESLVAELKPVFAKEQSLVRWIALRGACLFLDMVFSNDWEVAAQAVGIKWNGHGDARLASSDGLTEQQIQGCVGLHESIRMKVAVYSELENMSLPAVLSDPRFRHIGTAAGFDYIAWASVVLLRTDRAEAVVDNFGEPGRMDEAGWYTEPLFSKSERYYDGSDWTARCRVIERGREMLLNTPLA